MKSKLFFGISIIVVSLIFSSFSAALAQTPQACESCGMSVALDGQEHLKIVDGAGKTHYACCIICGIKLLTKNEQLNITSNCDWYGPNYTITLSVKENLSSITSNPANASVILGGGCAKNRIVYNQTAASSLLANNGTSTYLIKSQNTTIAANATVMLLTQAVKTYGVAPSPSPSTSPTSSPNPSPSPSPSPSPTPSTSPSPSSSPETSETPRASSTPSSTPISTPTPSTSPTITSSPTERPETTPIPTSSLTPTSSPVQTNTSPTPTASPSVTPLTILQCEACGMDVTPESQLRYKVTDGTGTVHYVECFMCALNLVNDYQTLHIVTYCDWYGPNYPITIDSTGNGQTIAVNPSTAMFLRGGSCVTARAAYNQTAADNLLANGFSQYTSPEQQYALPASTNVTLVREAIKTWYAQPNTTGSPTSLMLIIIAAVGVIFIVGSIAAYKKLSKKA